MYIFLLGKNVTIYSVFAESRQLQRDNTALENVINDYTAVK